ncbi:MAG: oxygen-dependent protoporphyrinogen oxidase [Candidatus Omnitrophota bacterium]|jgi:oxygen-dependent protoporphyrinogen oxidase
MGNQSIQDVVILGAGISGLACAHHLKEKAPQLNISILDSASHTGGVMQTIKRDGFIIERGPDSWLSEKKEALELIQKLGLEDELIQTNDVNRRSFILRDKRLRAVPEGFHMIAPSNLGAFIKSDILSLPGKMRLLAEPFIRAKRDSPDESIETFIKRRLGSEAYDYIAQPMVGGVYTGDPAQLSTHLLLKRFVDMETKHGSLIRAMRKNKAASSINQDSGPRYSLFLSLKEGMQSLTDALEKSFEANTISTNTNIESIQFNKKAPHWTIDVGNKSIKTNSLVMALPPSASANLLENTHSELATNLRAVRHESVVTISMGFRRMQIKHKLNGFGFVVPAKENSPLIACSFSSIKFTNRAPYGHVLLRAFVGGPFGKQYFDMNYDELLWLIRKELEGVLGLEGKPLFIESGRFTNSMPQYVLGHKELVQDIESSVRGIKSLYFCGNIHNGVGIPDCIRQAQLAANDLLKEKNNA